MVFKQMISTHGLFVFGKRKRVYKFTQFQYVKNYTFISEILNIHVQVTLNNEMFLTMHLFILTDNECTVLISYTLKNA